MINDDYFKKCRELLTLKESCKKSFIELQEIVKTREVRFKRNGNNYFIGDTLSKIKLSKEVIMIVVKYPPYVDKHKGIIPTNVAEFFQSTGKISQVVQRLETTLKFWKINDDIAKSYVEELLFFIYQLQPFKKIDKKSDEYKNSEKVHLPTCALCFEPIKKSKMNTCYCETHTEKEHQQKDRNALLKLIRSSETPEQKDLIIYEKYKIPINCDTLSKFLVSLSPRVGLQINYENLWHDDWKLYVDYFIKLVQQNYPLSFDKIKKLNINDFNSYNSYMTAFETALCNRPSIEDWLQLENNYADIQLILSMVRRVESYYILHRTN